MTTSKSSSRRVRPGLASCGVRLAICLAHALVALGCATPSAPERTGQDLCPGEIAGTVTVENPTGWFVRIAREWGIGLFSDAKRLAVDPSSGAFHLGGLATGKYVVDAVNVDGRRAQRRSVEVLAGQSTRVVLAIDPTRANHPIVVHTNSATFHLASPGADAFRLIRQDGSIVTARACQASAYSFEIDASGGPEDGTWTVELVDPRFDHWSRKGVLPGDDLHAWLRGSAILVLQAVARASGVRVEHGTVRLRMEGANSFPNEYVPGEDASWPADGRVSGVLPGNTTLLVSSEGFATQEIGLGVIAPGEVRKVRVELYPGSTIRGTVRNANGRPAEGVPVLLLRRGTEKHQIVLNPNQWQFPGPCLYPRWVASDSAGGFELPAVADGHYTLRALCSNWTWTDSEPVLVEEGRPCAPIPLELEATERVRGRVVGVTIEHLGDLLVYARSERRPKWAMLPCSGELGIECPVDTEGRFDFGYMPVGRLHLAGRVEPEGTIGTVDFGAIDVVMGERRDVELVWPVPR